MLLVRSTSKGLVALRFHGGYAHLGFSVAIGVFDESGWLREVTQWGSRDENNEVIPPDEIQASLGKTIAESVELPLDEATELAEISLTDWRDRGGEKAGKKDTILGLGLVTAIGGGVLLLIAAVIAIIVVVVILLA